MHGNKHQFGANIPSPPTKKTNALNANASRTSIKLGCDIKKHLIILMAYLMLKPHETLFYRIAMQ